MCANRKYQLVVKVHATAPTAHEDARDHQRHAADRPSPRLKEFFHDSYNGFGRGFNRYFGLWLTVLCV